MFNPASPVEAESLRAAQNGARALGLETYAAEVRVPEEIEAAFARMALVNVDSLLVVGSTMLFAHRRQICTLANRYRLPMIANTREFSDEGALLAFGPDVAYTFGQAAVYVARILNGESPAGLPFEQSSKLRLAVNLATARALDVAVPRSILVRADDTIQ
jgi:putative ABC transport system substrate-binding protein